MAEATNNNPTRGSLPPLRHRVLIYLTCYNVLDGVSLTIRKLEEEILAAGHHVCILTTLSGDPENTDLIPPHPNRQVIFMDNALPIPFLHDPERPELSYQLGFSLSQKVKEQIDEFEPTLVHITVPDCTTLHIIQYARSKELPIMGTYHSNIPEYMEHYPGLSWLKHIIGSFFRHQYNFMQTLFVPTPFIVRHLKDNYQMHRVTTMRVWGRGVDVDKFSPAYRSMEYRRSLDIADDIPILLWVGRLVPEKRPDIFARVVRRLHSRGFKFHALVVGAGPCEAAIKSLPSTSFVGWLSKKQLSTAYASADIFLFPSAVETFGNVTLEAAASGLPVVVESGCSGHLVHDGVNGFTAAAGDEEAFYENTAALVEDANMRKEFSASGREMAMTLENRLVVRGMLQNYDRVTGDFYSEYGGRHLNRDVVYTQPGSFRGGRYPRPMMLILCEWIFITLFMVLWKVCSAVHWLQKRFGPLVSSTNEEQTMEAKKPPALMTESKMPRVPSNLRRVSVVGMADVEIGDSAKTPSLPADDTTETTGSMGSDPIPTSPASFGDGRLSQIIAIAFVEAVMFPARIESYIWCTFVRPVFFANHFPVIRGKRKNSSVPAVSPTERRVGQRPRSDDVGAVIRRNVDTN